MHMLHRTQLLLETWQYDTLRSAAERESSSISSIVRAILTDALRPGEPAAANWIREVSGIADDPSTSGEDHDAYLYGAPPKTG